MIIKLAVVVNVLLTASVYLIFLVSVVANFFFNGFLLGIVGSFVLFLLFGWVIGFLDDMFWSLEHLS